MREKIEVKVSEGSRSGTVSQPIEMVLQRLKADRTRLMLERDALQACVGELERRLSRSEGALENPLRDLRRYQALGAGAFDLGVILSQDWRVHFLTPATCEALGYELEVLYQRPFQELIHPMDQEAFQFCQRRLEGNLGFSVVISLRLKTKEMNWKVLKLTFTNLLSNPDIQGYGGSAQEITLTHQGEQLCRHYPNEGSLKLCIKVDKAGIILEVLSALDARLPMTPSLMIGRSVEVCLPHGIGAKILGMLSAETVKEGSLRSSPLDNGTWLVFGELERDELGLQSDAAEAACRAILDACSESLAVQREGVVVFANQAFAHLTGQQTPVSLIGKPVASLFASTSQKQLQNLWSRTVIDGQAQVINLYLSSSIGSRAVGISAGLATFQDEPAVIMAMRDLTPQLNRLVEQIEEDRLWNMGRVSSGVLHEINDPLTYVLFNITLLEEGLIGVRDSLNRGRLSLSQWGGDLLVQAVLGESTDPLGNESIDDLIERSGEALGGIRRVREVLQSLRQFSLRGAEPARLDEAIQAGVVLMRNEIKYRATLELDVPNLPPVRGDLARLSLICLNVLMYAISGIPEDNPKNYTLRVRLSRAEDEAELLVEALGLALEEADPQESFLEMGIAITQKVVKGLNGRFLLNISPESRQCLIYLPFFRGGTRF